MQAPLEVPICKVWGIIEGAGDGTGGDASEGASEGTGGDASEGAGDGTGRGASGAVQVEVQAGAPGLWEWQKGIDTMLEGFQEFCDMITVCGSVMACYGKGYPGTFSLYEKFPGFKRRKIVGRTAIGMDGKMIEGNPWNAGYCVCIFRWLLWTLG